MLSRPRVDPERDRCTREPLMHSPTPYQYAVPEMSDMPECYEIGRIGLLEHIRKIRNAGTLAPSVIKALGHSPDTNRKVSFQEIRVSEMYQPWKCEFRGHNFT